MATREYDYFVRDDLVDQRIRKAVQQRAPHLLVVTHRRLHGWMQTENADRRVYFRNEGASQANHAAFVPAPGLSNLCARLRPEAHAPHD